MVASRELTEAQWLKIERLLPKEKPSPRGGRRRIDDREVIEGIFWVLRSGARWKDLPREYPSATTCWRRLREWEDAGVWLSIWRAFLSELDDEGQLNWHEVFADGTFASAKKGVPRCGKTKRGKGTKLMVVADGQGVPIGVELASASPHECTLIESTLKQVAVPQVGQRSATQES